MKKIITSIVLLLLPFFLISESLSLLKESMKEGMVLYWDTLSETGLLEKNGHQLSFRKGEKLALLDSMLLVMVDEPEIKDNEVFVTKNFMDKVNDLFKKDNSSSFKVGAILIDAGHGGKDPGALRTYKINNNDVTVREKDIVMTRTTDVYLSLSERTDIANTLKVGENEAALYISIHVNSSLNNKASGYEVWYLSPGYRRTVLDKSSVENDKSLFSILNSMMEEEYTTESIMIANFIMDGLKAQIGNESKARGIKAEEWFVVKNANMPSVLIELGFLTNYEEAVNLMSDKYLKKATLGIYNGIVAFITHFERSRGFTSVK